MTTGSFILLWETVMCERNASRQLGTQPADHLHSRTFPCPLAPHAAMSPSTPLKTLCGHSPTGACTLPLCCLRYGQLAIRQCSIRLRSTSGMETHRAGSSLGEDRTTKTHPSRRKTLRG